MSSDLIYLKKVLFTDHLALLKYFYSIIMQNHLTDSIYVFSMKAQNSA